MRLREVLQEFFVVRQTIFFLSLSSNIFNFFVRHRYLKFLRVSNLILNCDLRIFNIVKLSLTSLLRTMTKL